MRNATLASFILVVTIVSFLVLCACSKPPVAGGPARYNKMYHYQNMEDCPYDAEDWQHNRTNANNHGRDAREARKIRGSFTNPKTIEEALGLHRRADSAPQLGGRGYPFHSKEGGGE